jgi:class 3 adenylate cyclase
MAMTAMWQAISTNGLREGDAADERRRLIITNQGGVIGVASCLAFGTGFALAGPRFTFLAVANAIVVLLHLSSFWLTRSGRRTAAKAVILIPVHVLIITATLTLGLGVGFQYYFFLFAALAFLFFGERQLGLRITFGLMSALSCLFVCFLAPIADIMDLPAGVPETLDVISALSVMATLVFFVQLFTSDTVRAEGRLAIEHARSERLLLNVLPKSISARLKDDDKAIADGFAQVTVLFADLVGFTELSQRLGPAALVDMLNHVFSAFDDLAAELGLEKIKTIGDCYMVAAGLPDERPDHVEAAARMALGIREALTRINREAGYGLRLRIGLHTGPVIAGVIGKKKFIYDLWGDTVNTASRMESSGIEQEIQVTKQVYEQLTAKFDLTLRGTIKVKGKGELETYLLHAERAAPVVEKLEPALERLSPCRSSPSPCTSFARSGPSFAEARVESAVSVSWEVSVHCGRKLFEQRIELRRAPRRRGQCEVSPVRGKDLRKPFGGFDDTLDEHDVARSDDETSCDHAGAEAYEVGGAIHRQRSSNEWIVHLARPFGALLPETERDVLDETADVGLEARTANIGASEDLRGVRGVEGDVLSEGLEQTAWALGEALEAWGTKQSAGNVRGDEASRRALAACLGHQLEDATRR